MKQIIKASEGCPYSCPFCFNGRNEFKELPIPEIHSNYVILHDDAFLSKRNVIDSINELGSKRFNDKIVYYEILQGINVKDLSQDIANALYKNRFKKIRIAWDGSYTKKNMYRIFDGIKYLTKAGYKRKSLICYILSNYYVSLIECMLKLDILKVLNIPVCNCVYRKNYLDPKIYPELWTMEEIKYFRTFQCRRHSQLIKYNGYDPEIRKRLITAKVKPNKHLIENCLNNVILVSLGD